MDCKFIKGKIGEENKDFYLCTVHKQYEKEEEHFSDVCRYTEKEAFDYEKVWERRDIHELEFVFSIPYKSDKCEILVNKTEKVSALFIGNSRIIKDDFFGLYTSLKNQISLEIVKCKFCGHYHSDNEIFAVNPHDEHLCYYCGGLFPVERPNIGNELFAYFEIPKLKNIVNEEENVRYKYNLFTGVIDIL